MIEKIHTTKNCHYVSRFLCHYWGFGRKKRHRKVYFVDLPNKRIGEEDSDKLFSLNVLNSPEVERQLDALIETPIGRHKKNLIEKNQFEHNDPELLVALRLFPTVQQLRYFKAKNFPIGAELDSFLQTINSANKDEILSWAHQQEEKTKLMKINLRHNDLLFYPERGTFRIPIVPQNREMELPSWAVAFPIHPRVLLAYVPMNTDIELMNQLPLSAYSTAIYNKCERFIIPPDIILNHSHEYILDEFQRLSDVAGLQDELMRFVCEQKQIIEKLKTDFILGQLTASAMQQVLADQNKNHESLKNKMSELEARRNIHSLNEAKTGHTWTNWK